MAGMEVVEARINYLAYAPEIAAVMLRRQQASAIITAREKDCGTGQVFNGLKMHWINFRKKKSLELE